MRYVVIDDEGSSYWHMNSRDEVIRVLNEYAKTGGLVDDLAVLAYNDDGERVGDPELVTEVLSRLGGS